MSKISLKEKLQEINNLNLQFIGITSQKTKDKEFVAILTLAIPVPVIRGSQEVDFMGKRQAIVLNDVTEVKVHERDFNEDFVFDDATDTGTYKGSDLQFDVSKQGQAWLTSKPFSAAATEFRTKNNNDRLAKLFNVKAPEEAKADDKAKGVKPVDNTAKAVKA